VGENISSYEQISNKYESLINSEDKNRTRLLQIILHSSPNCIYVKDKQGRYIIANKTIADLYQTTPEEMIGKKDDDFANQAILKPDEAEFFKDIDKKAIETKETQTIPCESFTYKDGGKHYFFTKKIPITYQDDPDCVMGISVDITKLKESQKQALESEEKFRQAFEKSTIGHSLTKPDGTLSQVNSAFASMLGYTVEELSKMNFEDITHPDDIAESNECTHCLLSGEKDSFRFDKRYIHKNGKIVWTDVSTSLLRDSEKEPLFFITSIQDITGKKEMRQKFERIFTMSSELICEADINNATFTKINPAFTEVLGYSEEELLSKPFLDFIHPEDKEETMRVIDEQLQRGKKVLTFINRYRCKDGSYVWLDWNSHPIPEEGFTYAIARDISEIKKKEELLNESEERYHSYISNAPNGVFICDEHGRYLEVNDKAVQTTGYSKDELLQMSIVDMIPEEGKEQGIQHFHALLNEGKSVGDVPFVHKNGSVRWWQVNAIKISENRYLGFTEDVTEKKKFQEALIESERKYRGLYEAQVNGFAIFKSIFNEKGEFVSYEFIDINPAYERITGVKRTEVIGKDIQEVFPGTEQSWIDAYGSVAVSGESKTFEMYHEPTQKHYYCNVFRPWDDNQRFCVAFNDITKSKKAKKETEMILNTAADGIRIVAKDFTIKKMNDTFARMVGITKEEGSGRFCYDVFKSHDCETNDCPLVKVLQTGEGFEKETKRITADNREIPCILSVTPYRDEHDEIIGIIEDYRDISSLKQSQARFRNIFENKGTATGIFGNDSIITQCNSKFVEQSGYTKDEIIGKMHWYDFVFQDDVNQMMKFHRQRSEGGNPPGVYECRMVRKNRELVTMIVNIGTIPDSDERIVSLVDISKQKTIENELLRTQEELKKLNENLEAQVEDRTAQIQMILEQKDKYINQLGHDIKNPLGPLVNLLPLLEKKETDPKKKEKIRVMNRNVTYIKNLVTKTIQLAQL